MTQNKNVPFMLVLKKNESLKEALIQYANAHALNSAALFGIGALRDPVLGIFNETTKKYYEKKFEGLFELLSLNGNLTKAEGQFIAHLHVTLCDDEFRAFGGHLVSAEVGITAEILITPLAKTLTRSLDNETGLKLINNSV